MSQAFARPQRVTISAFDSFLAGQCDDGSWELIDGGVVAMTNPSLAHEEIVGNINAALRAVMPADRRCRVAVGGVRVQASDDDRGLYAPRPDVMVWCGPMQAERNFVTTPMIIVEVLSPSSMDNARGGKLRFYKSSFQTLRQIVLVYQDQRRVEAYYRADLGWEPRTLIHPAETLEFPALVAGMTLSDIYEGVELPTG